MPRQELLRAQLKLVAKHRSFRYGHLPENIYFDTSFLILATVGNQDERVEAARFMRRLLDRRADVFLSSLVHLEYWHAALVAAAKDYAGRDWQEDFKRPSFRKEMVPYAQPIIDRIDQLLNPFAQMDTLHVLSISTEDIANATRCMRDYGLDSYDAGHAGVMFSYEFYDIATNDRDFDAVDEFTLWLPLDLYNELGDSY